MKKLLAFLFFISHFSFFGLKAQNMHKIDSLQNEIKKFEAHEKDLGSKATLLMDSNKSDLLYAICRLYRDHIYDSAIVYGRKSLEVAQNAGYKGGIGNGYVNLGWLYFLKGNFAKGLDYSQKALSISKEAGDKKSMASACNNIGVIYQMQGNYPEALKNYLQSQRYIIEIGDTGRIIITYMNLGGFFEILGNYPEALKNDSVALKMLSKSGPKHDIAIVYNNIGIVNIDMNNYTEALKNELKALKIAEELGDKDLSANNYINIGDIYVHQGNIAPALDYYLRGIKLFEELGYKDNLAGAYVSISDVYKKQNNLNLALIYGNKGLDLGRGVGDKAIIIKAYQNLAIVNEKLQNFKAAYDYEIMLKQLNDSVNSNDNEKKLTALQMQDAFDKKQDSARIAETRKQDSIQTEQVKKDAISEKRIQNQKNIRNSLLAGLLLVLVFAGFIFRSLRISHKQKIAIGKEKQRSEELLLNILPAEVAEELKAKGKTDAKAFDDVTVMFTDFRSFTSISEKLSPAELVAELHYLFQGFDTIIHKYNIEKIKTIGDSYMAAGGLPVASMTHAKDVVNAALEIVQFIEVHKKQRILQNKPVFEIRIGINTGPVVAGIVGVKKFAYDIWGDTVNLASRMESSGEPGKVNISGSTYELVKNDFTCIHRGKIQAKNKGEVDMYFVER